MTRMPYRRRLCQRFSS